MLLGNPEKDEIAREKKKLAIESRTVFFLLHITGEFLPSCTTKIRAYSLSNSVIQP